jgi:hypothetical protein
MLGTLTVTELKIRDSVSVGLAIRTTRKLYIKLYIFNPYSK